MTPARTMWTLFEPLHAVTYFAPEGRAAFEAAGLRGFWRGYFASRSAPLGRAPAAVTIALYANFAPRMVERAIPSVWELASPEKALAARLEGSVAALSRLLDGQDVDEAAVDPADGGRRRPHLGPRPRRRQRRPPMARRTAGRPLAGRHGPPRAPRRRPRPGPARRRPRRPLHDGAALRPRPRPRRPAAEPWLDRRRVGGHRGRPHRSRPARPGRADHSIWRRPPRPRRGAHRRAGPGALDPRRGQARRSASSSSPRPWPPPRVRRCHRSTRSGCRGDDRLVRRAAAGSRAHRRGPHRLDPADRRVGVRPATAPGASSCISRSARPSSWVPDRPIVEVIAPHTTLWGALPPGAARPAEELDPSSTCAWTSRSSGAASRPADGRRDGGAEPRAGARPHPGPPGPGLPAGRGGDRWCGEAVRRLMPWDPSRSPPRRHLSISAQLRRRCVRTWA